MRHHRAAWRVERVGWVIIALLLAATLLGAFGGGPISHARSGSTQALAVEYDRLLRSHAPTEYRFQAHPSVATGGVVRLRIDNVLMDLMEVDSIVPAPDAQMGGVGYTEFAFLITLAQAQSVIALINGFPSWEQMSHKCAQPTLPSSRPSPSIESVIRSGLHFAVDEEPCELPIAYSRVTGNPTQYEWAHDAILRLNHEEDEALVRQEDDDLYAFMDRVRGNSLDGGFTSIAPRVLAEFEDRIRASLDRAPLNVEGHSMLAGVLHALGRYEVAVEASGPVVSTLTDLLPKDRKVQVSYGSFANRPFFRLLHCHLLVLDKLGQHRDADALAKLGLKLCPNDNIGFRYLKTRSMRARGSET